MQVEAHISNNPMFAITTTKPFMLCFSVKPNELKGSKRDSASTATYIAGVTGLVGWLVVVFKEWYIGIALFCTVDIFSFNYLRRHISLCPWRKRHCLWIKPQLKWLEKNTFTVERLCDWQTESLGVKHVRMSSLPAEAFHVAGWDLQLEAIAAIHAVVPLALAARVTWLEVLAEGVVLVAAAQINTTHKCMSREQFYCRKINDEVQKVG